MYPSGNMVLFVNEDDYFKSVEEQLQNLDEPSKPMILSISYNTDILATENIIPLTSRWIAFVNTLKNIKMEIRTKSANFYALSDLEPSKNVILSWSLSPDLICKKYERTAPSLNKRLNAMKSAIESGWLVRLCIDPVLYIKDWEKIYSDFISDIFNEIDQAKLLDVTLGVFRMNKDYFNRIRRRETKSDLFYANYSIENNIVTEEIKKRQRIIKTVKGKILPFIDEKRILIWE
jgi:spore photoproduct lyase